MAVRWLEGGAAAGVASTIDTGRGAGGDLLCWPGALRALPLVPGVSGAKRITLFTGDRSYRLSGAADMLAQVLPAGADLVRVEALSKDASLAELQELVGRLRRRPPTLLVAVGGARVLDQAKVVRVLAAQFASPRAVLAAQAPVRRRGVPLVAVPTMAASGAEVSTCAEVRVDGRRTALEHPHVRPDVALVDARLSASLPLRHAVASGVQVLGQAIDALWSVNGNRASQEHAQQALDLALEGLTRATLAGALDVRGRAALAEAALHGGLAANHARGALLHALALPLAEALDLPQADALAMLLPQVLRLNGRYRALPLAQGSDTGAVADCLEPIVKLLGGHSAESAAARLTSLLEALGLPTTCSAARLNDEVLTRVVDSINLLRLRNNPVQPTRGQLRQVLLRVRRT